ncbi:hypothetical protein EYC84_011365 [Monilinia fructicola]|uniref:Uncharacterized protein n=1 Tax=Monilinia fructicola TaxID=38448 RepID=A0A5M9J526_MONFR|nr:hypothetical protein EYC84_011365 [Monilinia fructicola]
MVTLYLSTQQTKVSYITVGNTVRSEIIAYAYFFRRSWDEVKLVKYRGIHNTRWQSLPSGYAWFYIPFPLQKSSDGCQLTRDHEKSITLSPNMIQSKCRGKIVLRNIEAPHLSNR